MAALTFFGVTGTFSAALKDSVYDVDTDPELAPMSGSVTFTPLIDSGNSVPAVSLTPASNLFLVPIKATIRSGVITSNGVAGVKLVANTAVLGLTGSLYYQVDFGDGLTAGGKTYSVRPFTFQAPTTATTVDLVEVTPAVGQPATGPVPSSAVLSVAGRTGNIVVAATDISNSSSVGRSVLTAADAAAARAAIGIIDGAAALTPTAVKTTGYTAAVGDLIPANATSGGFTITLPSAPADKSVVLVKKIDSSANAVTVQRSGSDVFNVAAGASTLQLVLQDQTVALQYKASGGIWYVTGHGMPLAGLDARFTSGDLTNPVIIGAIKGSNGNTVVAITDDPSAVSWLEIENGAGTDGPTLWARSSLSSADIFAVPKGPNGRFALYDADGNGIVTYAGVGGGNTSVNIASTGSGGNVQANGSPINTPATIHAATSKTTPVDADELDLLDSAAAFGLKKLTIANLKALIAAYIVNSAPGALDTLAELAAALGNDANFATTVTNALAAKASLTGAEVVTNKTLGTTNTVTVRDDRFTMQDDADATKQLTRDLANIPTGVTRKMVMPVSRTSQLSVANTTTETDIISMTLPTGVLVAGTTFRIRIAGTVQNQATSGTLTLTPYLGANFAQQFFVMPTQGSAAGPNKFWTEWDITVRTTGVSGTFVAGGGGLLPVGPWYPIGSAAAGTSVIDTTGTPVVKMTAQWQTASATNILLVETATIEQIV